jgi:RNA polymerase sigma-70 factor (ECF subfamily)
MLGTMADSEDVVQEAWLRWQATSTATTTTATTATTATATTATAGDRTATSTAATATAGGGPGIERPDAWLTTVTTRLALDRLRTTRRRREDYIGPWLPEPVVVAPGPEESAELSESLTLGFLTVFEKLQPVERAVFLMADVFGVAYPDVAEAVGKSEVACRQIASRARRRLRERPARPHAAIDRKIVDELLVAIALGDVETAMARLAPDAVLVSDGGAKRRAARRPVVGAARIVRLLVNLAHRESQSIEVAPVTVNGDPGIVVTLNGAVDLVAAFELDGERVAAIWMVRNPDKLENLAQPIVLA